MQRAREVARNQAGDLKPAPTPTEVGDSNNDGTQVQLSNEPMFGFQFDKKRRGGKTEEE